jgi:hypothetical protein
LADKLAISTQTPDLGIRKEFDQLLDKSHALITIGVAFLIKHPPQQWKRNTPVNHPNRQDVQAMAAKLPSGTDFLTRSRLSPHGCGMCIQLMTSLAMTV